MTDMDPIDWAARRRAAAEETLRKRAGKAQLRRDLDGRRQAGLDARHATKLNLADRAATADPDPGEHGCRYLVEEQPPRLCPNRRLPGMPLCRPHLTQAAELARRLGLDIRPDGEQP